MCTVEKLENKIVECRGCKYTTLKTLELPYEELDEIFKIYAMKLQGVFSKYKESLFNLKNEEEFMYDSNFKRMIQDLNSIENGEEIDLDSLKETLDILEDKINEKEMKKEHSLKMI